jgi:hypothetical protein
MLRAKAPLSLAVHFNLSRKYTASAFRIKTLLGSHNVKASEDYYLHVGTNI